MKNILLMLLAFTSLVYSQQKYDFEMDSLHVAWGEKNYSGPDDCSASVKLFSDGEFINIHVEVTDDILVFNDDPINSDHIELWFALPNLPMGIDWPENNEFILSDSLLYLINNQANLKSFQKFIDDPLINVGNYSGLDSFYYSQADSIHIDWIKKYIDGYLKDAKSSTLTKNKVFCGMVHFGILPGLNNAILYDREFYIPLKKLTGYELENCAEDILIEKKTTQSGYTFIVKVPSESLGFISKSGINSLKFLVDIIDVDDSKQETLLSSSKERIWGNSKSFNYTYLKNSISVNIHDKILSLGGRERRNVRTTTILKYFSDVFMKTIEGWIPIEINGHSFYRVNRPEQYVMKAISKIEIKHGKIGYRVELMGNNEIEYINTSSGEFLIFNPQKPIHINNIIESFLLPNGDPAFLYSEFELSGAYDDYIISTLHLIIKNKDEVIASFYDSYSFPSLKITNKIRVDKKWNYDKLDWNRDENNIDWSNVIVHKANEPHLILDLGNDVKYQIKWDEDGKIISANEIE